MSDTEKVTITSADVGVITLTAAAGTPMSDAKRVNLALEKLTAKIKATPDHPNVENWKRRCAEYVEFLKGESGGEQ